MFILILYHNDVLKMATRFNNEKELRWLSELARENHWKIELRKV